MNAIDGIYNVMSSFLEKVASWIPNIEFPWDKFFSKWSYIEGFLKQANSIFPIDSLLTIAGLMVSFLGVMLILWGIKFLRDMIPFF